MKRKKKSFDETASALSIINMVARGLKVGEKIQVLFDDDVWYKGTVKKIISPTVYMVLYDDGDKDEVDLEEDQIKMANGYSPSDISPTDRLKASGKVPKPKDTKEWQAWTTQTLDFAKTTKATNAAFAEYVFDQLELWKAAPSKSIMDVKKLVEDLHATFLAKDAKNNKKNTEKVNDQFRKILKDVNALMLKAGTNSTTALLLANRLVSNPSFRVS